VKPQRKPKGRVGGRPPLPPEERRQSLTVRLPVALIEQVKRDAAEHGETSASRAVEQALRQYYNVR
jgi:metal-responsive CopG/Arc/MetJ family transcriptional regulator